MYPEVFCQNCVNTFCLAHCKVWVQATELHQRLTSYVFDNYKCLKYFLWRYFFFFACDVLWKKNQQCRWSSIGYEHCGKYSLYLCPWKQQNNFPIPSLLPAQGPIWPGQSSKRNLRSWEAAKCHWSCWCCRGLEKGGWCLAAWPVLHSGAQGRFQRQLPCGAAAAHAGLHEGLTGEQENVSWHCCPCTGKPGEDSLMGHTGLSWALCCAWLHCCCSWAVSWRSAPHTHRVALPAAAAC